jgi:hypothetical protein
MSTEREQPDLDIVREEMERIDEAEELERADAPEPEKNDDEERDRE